MTVLKSMILVAAVAMPSAASAAPILWVGNGHHYEFVASPVTWTQALADAQAMTHLGQTGYLATVTSAEENAFLTSISTSIAWLAGTDAETEGVWRWAAGPEAGQVFFGPGAPDGAYNNWNVGEPNSLNDNEDYIHMGFSAVGGWIDADQRVAHGYFVEFAAVPEPATWAMMIGGFGLVGGAMRSQRRRTLAAA